MAEEKPAAEKKDEPTRDDKMSAMHDAFGKMCDRMDAMGKRMDAFMSKHSKKDESEEDAKKDAKKDGEEDMEMSDRKDAEEEGEKEPKKDAKADAKADAEGEEKEPKKDRKDAKKADGEEDPKEKPEEMASDDKKDAAKDSAAADARADALQAQIDTLTRQLRRPVVLTDDEINALGEAQTAWDKAAQAHGLRASRPMDGETLTGYERRHAKRFQQHSKKWGKVDLAGLPREVLDIALPEIRQDTIDAAYRGGDAPNAVLREIRVPDRTGRVISEFVGPVSATLAPFRMPVMRVKRINNNPGQFV